MQCYSAAQHKHLLGAPVQSGFKLAIKVYSLMNPIADFLILLPTGSEEREVLGVGSIIIAILPSCQYVKILMHYSCTDMNIVG